MGDTKSLQQKTDSTLEVYLKHPQAHNTYSYTVNNPLKYKDRNGEWLDIVVDAGFTAYSAYKLGEAVFTGKNIKSEAINFSLDLGGAVVPGVVGVGTARRVAQNGDNLGGAYKDVRGIIKGNEAHHIPADSISPFSKGRGPAISMDKVDHRETASWGRSLDSIKHRDKQSALIENNNFMKAFEMDVKDVQTKFGNKYNNAISQARAYAKSLLKQSKSSSKKH